MYPNGRAFVAKAKQWRDEAVSSLDREVRVSQNFETSMLALEDPLCAPGLVQAFVESLKGVFHELGEQAMTGTWGCKYQDCERSYRRKCTQAIKGYLDPILFEGKPAQEREPLRVATRLWLEDDVIGVGCSDKEVANIFRIARDVLDVFAIPEQIDDKDVVDMNRKVMTSLAVDGNSHFRQHFGDRYALRISQLRTSAAGLRFQSIMERAKAVLKSQGEKTFGFMTAGISTFREWLFSGCVLSEAVSMETIDGVLAWNIQQADMEAAVNFAKEAGDQVLKSEVYFLENVRLLVHPFAEVAKKLRSVGDDRDSRSVNQDWSKLARSLRVARSRFSIFVHALADMKLALYQETPGRLFVSMVIDASEWSTKLLATTGGILAELGQMWTKDILDVTTTLNKWCPDWVPHKDELMEKKHTALVLELCKNPHYKDLAGSANGLTEMLQHIAAAQSDRLSCQTGVFVDEDHMRDARNAAALARRTTVVTYSLFKLKVEFRKIKNEMVRATELDNLKKFIGHVDVGSSIADSIASALSPAPTAAEGAAAAASAPAAAASG